MFQLDGVVEFLPLFYVSYVDEGDYWQEYNKKTKSMCRLCDQCPKQICKSSKSSCSKHLIKKKKPEILKKKPKRLNTDKQKKTNTKKRKYPLKTIIEENNEELETDEINESLGIVISISSSLNKKQISQVKEFIKTFHNNPQSIQLTCESQLDYIDDTTTHVITIDSGSFSTIITKQIIQACVRHIFIGSINWITSSLEQSSLLDHFPYEILRDKKSSIDTRGIKQCRFDQLPVFPSSCILAIECDNGIEQMNINRDELIEIIELSGASLLNDFIDYKKLIILCNTKKQMIESRRKYLDNHEKEISYCKPEFLFNSIVRHEVQLIEKYLW